MRWTGRGDALRTRAWWLAASLLGAAALVPTVSMAVAAYLRPDWALTAGVPHEWWRPAPDNHLLAVGTLLLWGAAMLAFSRARGVRRFLTGEWMVLQAVLTLVLGAAAYSPCLGTANWVSLPMWLLNLFAGQMDAVVIGPLSTVCGGEYPLAFQVARFLGIGTIALAGIALLVNASRTQLDRRWAHRARDIDVVAGVNELSLDLIEALVAARRQEPGITPFYRETPWEWLSRRLRRSRRVLVIRANREDPLLAKAEALGARVYDGDPSDVQVLKRVLLRRGGDVSAHRFFAVTTSQARNADILQAALAATAGHRRQDPTSWLSQPYVPRLVARFDDVREARDFRLDHLDEVGCFVDALSSDELLAREIVARVRDTDTDVVAIIGDTPLTVALLDEFVLRRAFARAVESHRRVPPSPPRPQRTVVCAPGAGQILAEWQATRAPSDLVEPMVVQPAEGDWETTVVALGRSRSRLAVIVTDETALARSQAGRASRLLPGAPVFCRAAKASGVEFGTLGRHAVIRFGTTLLQTGGVPEDSWTVLAREAHARSSGTAASRPGSRPWGDPTGGARGRLPDFYREDSLRRQRWVLQATALAGYSWRALRSGDPIPDVPNALVGLLAHAEHERWSAWRIRNRWTRGDPSGDRAVMDQKRQNPNLVAWHDAGPELRRQNTDDIRWFIDRFREWGIVPVRRFTRRGLVVARPLTEARTWTTRAGSVLRSEAGDWWVEDVPDPEAAPEAGSGRGVAAAEFERLYRPVDAERGLYQRQGTVTAVRVTQPMQVATLEGQATAQPGDWLVTDDGGDSWPVPDAVFQAGYRPRIPDLAELPAAPAPLIVDA